MQMNVRARLPMLALCALTLARCGGVLVFAEQASQPPRAAQAAQTPPATQQSYRFGPEDTFVVRGPDIEEIADKPFKVDPSGNVTLPMVGSLRVAGLSVAELETQINTRLKRYINKPDASVSVTEVRSLPVSVFGAVNTSGVHQAQGGKRLIEVLSLAGGLSKEAGNTLTVTRRVENGPLPLPGAALDPTQAFWIAKIDVTKLMSAERPEDNIQMLANDIVSVQKADLVYVIGDVNRAGAIPLTGRLTVTEALAKSEGLQKSASKKNVRILRQVAGSNERQEIPVDFHKVLEGKVADKELQANDIIVIPNNVTRSAALRTLEAALQIGTGLIIWH
jgi:polysaccharide export outer membrane protein